MRYLVWLSLLVAVEAFAAETRVAEPDATPPPASIEGLAWLAGAWNGDGFGGPAHAVYSAPSGGQIAGHFRQDKDAGIAFYELVAIAEVNGSLEYRVKHFNADLTAWEEKDDVETFPLVAVEGDTWYFDGLTVRRDGDNGLVEAVLARKKDGSTMELVFRYRRGE